MKTLTLYSASELQEVNPSGFERALEHWRNTNDEIFWSDEIIESLKAIIKASGLTLRNWGIGAYSYSFIKIDWERDYSDGAGDLEGNRALAWLENNLLNGLREHRPFSKRVNRYNFDGNKPHVYTRYGKIPDCPFTGYCADDDYLESLIKDIKDGCTLRDAYNNLADVCQRLLEQEAEYQNSEEYFLDHAEANDYEFTEDGQRVY